MKLWMLGVFPGVLPMTSSASKERLLSGPGGRPEADGQKVLDPEVLDSEVPMLVSKAFMKAG